LVFFLFTTYLLDRFLGGRSTPKEKGCTAKEVGAALKAVSITAFNAEKWSSMIAAFDVYITGKVEYAAV
jgi:hypothetical protein